MSGKIIKASEIAEYLYCRRAWWLTNVVGYEVRESKQMAAGSAYHRNHGALAWQALAARWLAYFLVFVAVAIFTYLIVSGMGF